jgi:hypothetical protein
MLFNKRFFAAWLILGVFCQQPAFAEPTVHRVKRKLHKMEHRAGMLVNHMGLFLMEEVFPPLSEDNFRDEEDETGGWFNFSFSGGRDKPQSGHHSQSAKPSGHAHPAKKK